MACGEGNLAVEPPPIARRYVRCGSFAPPVDHTSDWLEELEGILKRFDAISNCAQGAVRSVIESFLEDKDTTEDEIVCVAALLARHTPRPEETRQERLPTLVYQRTRQARPTAVALSQGTN